MKQRKTLGTIASSLGALLSRRKEPQLLKRMFACLLLGVLCVTVSMAQSGPEMGKTYKITGITLTSYGPYVALPSHAFNSNAKSVKLSLTGSAVLKTGIMKSSVYEYTDAMESSYGDGNVSGVCLNLSGDYVTAAISGKLLVGAGNGTKDYTVYVTNYASEDGAANDTGVGVTADADNVIDANNPGTTGGETEGETDGNSDNTGSGIQMGVKTEINIPGGLKHNIVTTIPASSFLSKAQSAIVVLVGSNYCLYANSNTKETIREFQWNDGNKLGATIVLTGDLLQAAKQGYLTYQSNGGDDCHLYVTNFESETPTREQLTEDIPTIYLTVPAAINKNINDVLKKENGDAPYYQATIQVVDNSGSLEEFTDSKLEIKVRGNSTAEGMKRPYRLKFGKDDKDPVTGKVITSHKHDLLGAGYMKRNWVLLANAFDGSMVRNALSYRVGQLVGMDFCPGWKFVDLVINEEYRGTYMVSDHIEAGKHRIDVDEDTGWYIEANGQERMAEEPKTSGGGLTLSIKNPEPATEDETAALKSAVSTFFTDLSTKFSASNSSDPTTGWRSMADEESLLALWLGVNITANWDGFMTVKMYRNVDDPRIHFGPLWDHDLSLGNYEADKLLNHRIEEYDNGNFNQLMRKAWTDPLFIKKLHAKWHQLIQAGLKKNLLDYVGMLVRTIKNSEVLNHQKWPTYQSGFEDSGLKTHAATIDLLNDFIDKHIDNIQTIIDVQYDAFKEQIDNLPEEGQGGGQGGEEGEDEGTGPALGTEYVVPNMTFNGNYNDYNVSASAFNSAATSARVTVKNAYYIKYKLEPNAYNPNAVELIEFKNTNNQPQTGTYTLTGEELEKAKAGQLYINCDGNTNITVTVLNNRDIDDPTNPGTDPDTPSETFTQLTDLPTMYLQIYKLNADGTSDKTQTETITASGGDYHTARIVIVDENGTIKERDEETEIRGRGNSTWSGDNLKNPYRLKFPTKTKLLSYVAEDGTVVNNYANAKSWTLLSNKGDYSLIRNALTAELGKYMDMPFVPAYKFVDLVVNGNYAGTYQISDQIQVAKDRINVNSDTGWLLSANRGGNYQEDPYFTAGGASFNIKNPEADVATAQAETTDPKYGAMKAWMSDALATPYINGANRLNEETLAAKFDIESLANYIIGIDITGDPDGAIDNFYMYREDDASSKMKFGPMWDYDLAYGNADRDCAKSHFFSSETYGWGYKVNQMYNTPTVIKAIWKRWKEVYGEYDSATGQSTLTKYLLAKVDELDAIIAQSQAKNFEAGKAGTVAGSLTYSSHADAIAALKTWIPEHVEWLNTTYKSDYKTITGLDPDVCVHTYTAGKYTSNGDGTYSRECDICGMPEEGGTKVYKYITYNEDGTTNEVFNESKTWAQDNAPANPNAIFVVEEGSGITGKNVIVEKNGKYTCEDFELTDGYTFTSPIKFTAEKATYSRNVTNDWGTICLPYKVQNAKADDATYYQLKSVGEGNSTLVFEVATSTGAYTPLVFKRKSSGTSITVSATDVTVKASSEDKTKSTVPEWTLIGTMEQKVINDVKTDLAPGEELYYISQNKFWHATGKYTSNPFRAYFICKPATPASAAKSFSIGVTDDFTTSIGGMVNDALAVFVDRGAITLSSGKDAAVRIYTASGSLVKATSVAAGASKTISLPAGLYVVNGTKITVK